MKKLSLFLMLIMFGLGLTIQTALVEADSAEPLTQAPFMAEAQGVLASDYGARIVVAPYAQVVPNNSYTFIGISHPSLATAHTSIGVAVEAMNMTTVPDNAAGRAAVFTVDAGQTHRVFIVNQGHSTINAANSAFTGSQTSLITTSDATQFGNIKVTGIGTSPRLWTGAANRPGAYTLDSAAAISRWDNVAQLSMWGVVYQESNGAGFALEFIGDMHDSSQNTFGLCDEARGLDGSGVKRCGGNSGRGIN